MREHLAFSKPTSNGELIHPAQPISAIDIEVNAETKLNLEYIKGKWSYLVFAGNNCDLNCEAGLFKIRQAKRATGKDVNRVQYFLLFSQGQNDPVVTDLLSRHPQLTSGNLIHWKTQTEDNKQKGLQPGFIYLVDPFGNVMMKYGSNATSKGILKDIKKLLRISNIG